VTTSSTTATLFNATATTLNIGGAATAITLGAAGATVTGGGALTINSGAATTLTLDSGTTGGVNLGTSANAKTVTIGNVTGATAVNVNTGTGGSTYTTTNGPFTLATGTGTVNISNDATANTVNIGTGAGAKTITIGNNNTTTALNFTSGTGAQAFTSAAATTSAFTMAANSLTTGTGLAVSSSGTIATPGALATLTANNATTGNVATLSGTGVTTGKVLQMTGGTAMTTGSVLQGSATYVHTALNDTGSLASLSFSDTSTNANNGGTTNGLSVSPTVNTTGAGTKTINGVNVASTLTGCTTGACTYNPINIAAITGQANTTINGINIANLTGTAAVENAITLGTGWDTDLVLNDTTPVIELGATDNTATLKIVDSAATPNSLFEVQDIATNFGGLVSSGGFFGSNSYFGEEFNADVLAATNADSQAIGDDLTWYFDQSGAGPTIAQADTIGGFARVTFSATNRGIAMNFGSTLNNQSLIFLKDNLPTLQMKMRVNQNTITRDYVWGFHDQATALTANDGLPANGMFFSSNNGTSWVGVVRSGGANVGTTTCSGTISTTQFAVGRIVVESATSVRFYIDNDASDGVSLVDCGAVSGANPTAALGVGLLAISTAGAAATVDLDYVRVWQDDPEATLTSAPESSVSLADVSINVQSPLDGSLVKVPEKYVPVWSESSNVVSYINAITEESPRRATEFLTTQMGAGYKAVADFVAERITAVRGYFDETFARKTHTEELCVGTIGDEVCVNKDQLRNLLNAQNQPQQQTPPPVAPPTVPTQPTITLNGNAMAELHVGDTYSDLGVIAKDANGNDIAYTTLVDGVELQPGSAISIDTSVVGVHTIVYQIVSAENQVVVSATRTVTVTDANQNPSPDPDPAPAPVIPSEDPQS
jgi:hypothetical protein